MPSVVKRDKSVQETTVSEIHPARTTPQGSQEDGVLNGHEDRDVDFGALGKWFAILAVIIAGSFGSMAIFFQVIVAHLEDHETAPSPFVNVRQVPPEPYIEGLDLGGEARAGGPIHLLAHRTGENLRLKSWGLVTQDKDGPIVKTIPADIVAEVAKEGPPANGEAGDYERHIPSMWSGGTQMEAVR